MTRPPTRAVQPVPQDNQCHKGPGSAPDVPLDTTKGHRDDEKHNIREQAASRQSDAEHQQPPVGVKALGSQAPLSDFNVKQPALDCRHPRKRVIQYSRDRA